MPEPIATTAPVASVAIACGGTGGHLFPGVAVGEELRSRGCDVTLMVSPKEIDQQAIRSITGMELVTLPAVGLNRGGGVSFLWGFWKSYRLARQHFRLRRPQCVLAMGGFTSAPPIFAGRLCDAKTFLHESNSIPGRANRWLTRWVDGAFVYFPPPAAQLCARRVEVAGMPVRPQFRAPMSAAHARQSLGLAADGPVLLVMGGSQGATKINELMLKIVPQLRQAISNLQFMHLTGSADFERVRDGYAAQNAPAKVWAFFEDMGTALAAADAAISRAGASSLAELAARQLPAVLIPYPAAADNHQYFNAKAFVQSGAARMLQQDAATEELLAGETLDLIRDVSKRSAMQRALAAWHTPTAAADIAEKILNWGALSGKSAGATGVKIKAPKMGLMNC